MTENAEVSIATEHVDMVVFVRFFDDVGEVPCGDVTDKYAWVTFRDGRATAPRLFSCATELAESPRDRVGSAVYRYRVTNDTLNHDFYHVAAGFPHLPHTMALRNGADQNWYFVTIRLDRK